MKNVEISSAVATLTSPASQEREPISCPSGLISSPLHRSCGFDSVEPAQAHGVHQPRLLPMQRTKLEHRYRLHHAVVHTRDPLLTFPHRSHAQQPAVPRRDTALAVLDVEQQQEWRIPLASYRSAPTSPTADHHSDPASASTGTNVPSNQKLPKE
jgi:hypothetical protein